MDVKDYISSGILESYVLGAASNQEQREVQCLSAIYPEITEALRALEGDMETFAKSLAVEPPTELKGKIMAAIENVEQDSVLKQTTTPSKQVVEPAPMTITKTKRPWLAAASLAALIGLTAIFFVNQNSQKEEIVALQQQVEDANKNTNQLNDLNALLAKTATRKIELKGTEAQPDANVSVFWNSETQDVAFTVNNLQELPSDKDYQLWAIVDGKPTDMGVMDFNKAVASIVKGGKQVANAQAFAITIEPKGGSKDPTLSAMVVVGNT